MVNVLLVFNLGRLDIAPAPDLTIRRVMRLMYGLPRTPSAEYAKEKMRHWSPYASIASMYLWQAKKLKVSAAELRSGRRAIDKAGLRSGS
jgi:3-methyladenine DNA glycosylase/8-oxoguanine DNA glycosylase